MAKVVVVREGRMGFKLGDEVEVPDGSTYPDDFAPADSDRARHASELEEVVPDEVVLDVKSEDESRFENDGGAPAEEVN